MRDPQPVSGGVVPFSPQPASSVPAASTATGGSIPREAVFVLLLLPLLALAIAGAPRALLGDTALGHALAERRGEVAVAVFASLAAVLLGIAVALLPGSL
jgi:hypothetical protein